MFNPLLIKYTSIRKAKKAYKKHVGNEFPRWYLYKDKYMKLLRYPFTLPPKWEWLKHCALFYEFERSFATRYLFWKEETIDKLHKNGGSLF